MLGVKVGGEFLEGTKRKRPFLNKNLSESLNEKRENGKKYFVRKYNYLPKLNGHCFRAINFLTI
jgi:hypothetical protein